MYIYSLKISHLGRHCSPHKPQTNKSFNNKHKKVSFGLLGRDVQETPRTKATAVRCLPKDEGASLLLKHHVPETGRGVSILDLTQKPPS